MEEELADRLFCKARRAIYQWKFFPSLSRCYCKSDFILSFWSLCLSSAYKHTWHSSRRWPDKENYEDQASRLCNVYESKILLLAVVGGFCGSGMRRWRATGIVRRSSNKHELPVCLVLGQLEAGIGCRDECRWFRNGFIIKFLQLSVR